MCLTPALYRVLPFKERKGSTEKPTKEIHEFCPNPILKPFTSYLHHIYVYPQSLNISGSAHPIVHVRSQSSTSAIAC